MLEWAECVDGSDKFLVHISISRESLSWISPRKRPSKDIDNYFTPLQAKLSRSLFQFGCNVLMYATWHRNLSVIEFIFETFPNLHRELLADRDQVSILLYYFHDWSLIIEVHRMVTTHFSSQSLSARRKRFWIVFWSLQTLNQSPRKIMWNELLCWHSLRSEDCFTIGRIQRGDDRSAASQLSIGIFSREDEHRFVDKEQSANYFYCYKLTLK